MKVSTVLFALLGSVAMLSSSDATRTSYNKGTVYCKHSYTGNYAGGSGSYQRVANLKTCAKETVYKSNTISPFDDDVSLIFRGPLFIDFISVYDGSSGTYKRVSSYDKFSGTTDNMVFMNNANVDWLGGTSPEGFATADGKGVASFPVQFGGYLAPPSNPYTTASVMADVLTGAEVHIMSGNKCDVNGVTCPGYHDSDGTAFSGWGGSKKMFATRVYMPHDGSYDLPAIWILSGQTLRSSQYGCNCRNWGAAGGCGELDIAETLSSNKNKVATHYYFYDGKYPAGDDTYCDRPSSGPVTFITIIDESYGVKVLQIGGWDFDFAADVVDNSVIQAWLNA